MALTLDHQIGMLRKHAIEHEFTARVPNQGGLLDAAFSTLTNVLESWHYEGAGKLDMSSLKADFLGQMFQLIDSLAIDSRVKALLRQELPFGTSVVLNLIEVIPSVIARSGSTLDPREILASPTIVRAANQIGSCPGYIAPVIRREFTRYKDVNGITWVRADAIGNERQDYYMAENFTFNSDGAMRLEDEIYLRIESELDKRENKVSYGGCPASRFMIGHGYGNLLNTMAQVVTQTCIDYYDFGSAKSRIVPIDNVQHIFFPDPIPGNMDLYD
jgi:hypothetical protein